MFVLEGGPRQGQLVDELPTGYRPVIADAGPVRVELFEDFVARKARWIDQIEQALDDRDGPRDHSDRDA